MGTYANEVLRKKTVIIRRKLEQLPDYVSDFIRGIDANTSILTRAAYVTDLKVFFEYLSSKVLHKEILEITLDDIQEIKSKDIENFLQHLSLYESDVSETTQNGNTGKHRKLATIRSFYNYLYKREDIKINPSLVVKMPTIHKKNIIQLDVDEVATFLDVIDYGIGLTEKQLVVHKKNRARDLALATLMLGTGMRVSECVGVNLEDLDFNNNAVKVVVKGQDERLLYFSKEVEQALKEYLEEREIQISVYGAVQAQGPLFVYKDNRISTRTVLRMVKKYAAHVTTLKKITPHKLRSTFATQVYRETGDIYLVADLLGHSDVNTTKRHYARMDDERRRRAIRDYRLRE